MPTSLTWDWKSGPDIKELREALKPHGVLVYDDPSCEGTDSYGVIFSREPMNAQELAAVSDENYG